MRLKKEYGQAIVSAKGLYDEKYINESVKQPGELSTVTIVFLALKIKILILLQTLSITIS